MLHKNDSENNLSAELHVEISIASQTEAGPRGEQLAWSSDKVIGPLCLRMTLIVN